MGLLTMPSMHSSESGQARNCLFWRDIQRNFTAVARTHAAHTGSQDGLPAAQWCGGVHSAVQETRVHILQPWRKLERNEVGRHLTSRKTSTLTCADRKFLQQTLPRFAKENPAVEMVVYPRPNHHPMVRGTYSEFSNGGHERVQF